MTRHEQITMDLPEFIRQRNAQQSAAFCDPEARLERQLYRQQHPTEVLALECMDGRLNLALYTETPQGIIQPFRNIGGKFDLGWPFLQTTIRNHVDYALEVGRRTIVFVTYHYSKSNTHWGCKGFLYDTCAAREAAFKLYAQFERVFGKSVVYPIVVGLETDEESLIFHGAHGVQFPVADAVGDVHLTEVIRGLYPDMHPQMQRDLCPLVEGNLRHVREVRGSGKEPLDLQHREQIIELGRGFDWLHLPNAALIVGPYHDWRESIATAGDLALSNLNEGRIPKEYGVLLLVTALTRDEEGSFGWNMAVEKSAYLMEGAKQILEKQVPDLWPQLKFVRGVVSAHTRRLHELEA